MNMGKIREITKKSLKINGAHSIHKHVELTIGEMQMAVTIGTMRRLECFRMGNQNDGFGKRITGIWDADIDAAGSEIAVAKYKNFYWGGTVNTFHGPDILQNIQVRASPRGDCRLIFRPEDNPEEYFVLVSGNLPSYIVMGFLKGKECMEKGIYMAPNNCPPAWFVEQYDLKDIDFLDSLSGFAVEVNIENQNNNTGS
jgi:hypothetical protein